MTTSNSTTSPDSTASIGGNQPLPEVGTCYLCDTQGPIRYYLCIDCLHRLHIQRNRAFNDILGILEQDDLTVFDNFESHARMDGRRVVEIDAIKSAKELIRLYWSHRNNSMNLVRLHRNAKKQLDEALNKIEDQKKQISLLRLKIDERILDL